MAFTNRQAMRPVEHNSEPKEYIYTDGYGFSPYRPDIWELKAVSEAARTVGLSLLAFFLLGMITPSFFFAALQMLASALNIALHAELASQLSSAFAMAVSVFVPFWFIGASGREPSPADYNTVKPGFTLAAAAGFIAVGVSVIGMYFSAVVQSGFEAAGIVFGMVGYSPPAYLPAKIFYWLNLVLVPAFFEEMAFRKYLLGYLRRFGDGFALLVSSMVFALIHILPIRWPFALLMGLVIGYFVLVTGSVRVGIFLHALNNALTLFAMMMENQNKTDLLPALQSAYLLLALGALLWLVHKRERFFELKPGTSANTQTIKMRIFWSSVPMVLVVLAVLGMAFDRIISL